MSESKGRKADWLYDSDDDFTVRGCDNRGIEKSGGISVKGFLFIG